MINKGIVGVLINYRDARRSFNCIKSLIHNKVDQIIIWDNSEDCEESLHTLKSYIAHLQNIEFIYSNKNLGFSAAINRLLLLCQKKYPNNYVLIINNDAVLLEDGAAILVEALEQSNNYALAVPRINNAGSITESSYYNKWLGLLSFSEKSGYFRYPSGCCLLINPNNITMPFFNENFFMYGEDWELGWRLTAKSIKYVDKVLVNHEGSASSGLGSKFYEEHMTAAHLIFSREVARNNIEYVLMIGLRLLILPLRAFVRSFRFRSLTPFYALFSGMKIAWFD